MKQIRNILTIEREVGVEGIIGFLNSTVPVDDTGAGITGVENAAAT